MRYYGGFESRRRPTTGSNGLDAFIVGLILAIIALVVFLVHFYNDASARLWKWFWFEFLQRGFFPGWFNPLHFTWLTWLCLAIIAGIVAFAMRDRKRTRNALVACGLLFLVFLFVAIKNVNDHSASYAGSTVFVVEDTEDTPLSLKRLVDDTSENRNDCDLYAHNDMQGCIKKGSFDFEWDARVSSLTGAITVMRRSSGGVSNTVLLKDTLTYVYGDKSDDGMWTAIRDGKNRQAVFGVSSWSGQGNVTTCRFTGQYAMKKAFAGKWGKNLSDEIAGRYPKLFYDESDRYGYCDGDEPVIAIPVKKQITFRTRTAFRSAGMLIIKGSPDGDAEYSHVWNAKPGEYPGPVYPASLAAEQRESMGMIAGYWDSVTGKFGYEPTDVETQSGNASEYQLRDKNTGRIYWITPMKPRSSDDQVLAAYSVIPADQAGMGTLNEQHIYVLPDSDPRSVNIDDLEARTRQAVLNENPGFYSARGRLVEFLPLSGEKWQVYAELGGRVVYRITVPTDSRIKTEVVNLDDQSAEEAPVDPATGEQPEHVSACSTDVKSLSDTALAQCLADLAEELNNRQASKKPK